MKKRNILSIIALLAIFSAPASGNDARSVKCISSCEIDINQDTLSDIVLEIESSRGIEVLVLMKKQKGYQYFHITGETRESIFTTCKYGKSIFAKEGKTKKKIKTNGTFIEVWQPEGARRAFIWDGKDFKEYWLSD